jgi:pyruvate formate lyase activating enzyme
MDAANVDLKAFSDSFYLKMCGARLEPVKDTLRRMKQMGILVEITTLLIPTLNDKPEELEALARFIVQDLGAETPWHVSRFHPAYHMDNLPSTPTQTLIQAREIGQNAGLKFVYLGNLPGMGGENTDCPGCGKTLIERRSFHVLRNQVQEGKCPHCKAAIYGVDL